MSNANGAEQGLKIEKRGGVALLIMDLPGESQNTLKADFAADFERTFTELERDASVDAVVFASGKKDSFIAGADVKMLSNVTTSDEAAALSRRGQDAMNRIASFRKPVVAAIHGACLGGGLELALACHERVASDHPKTKLGVPEVQLGLLPGAGGTQRLPRLIGLEASLDLMLTGKQIPARKAKKLGLVDEVVPAPIVIDVAVERATKLARGETSNKKTSLERKVKDLALSDNPIGRKLVFDQAKKALLKKTHGNYPAPERILEVVRVGLEKGLHAGLEAEAAAFGKLTVTSEAAQLMNIFFATTELKKDTGVDPKHTARTAEEDEPLARDVHKLGMLGAGLMGAGIAYVTAELAKIPVRLKDKNDDGVRAGLKHIREVVDERVKRKRMSRMEADRLMASITTTTDMSGFEVCDVVIEAVFEDLELKREMLRDVEQHGKREVIFASNTSSIPIGRIAEASKHPETVIGMHYFSPVHKMPLLEIIVTDKTAPWVTATAVALGKKQGKTVIVVRDGVGFYTTRILAPFMNEAALLVADGVPIDKIDNALRRFGFPVGPIKLTDEVGIDVGAKVGKIMVEAFGDRMTPPKGMERLVADKRFGRKNKRGFYRYNGKKKGVDESVYDVLGIEPNNTTVSSDEIAWRCTLQMVNEAARCFEEGILRSARDGDIGAIFGLGFPPFRGGPFRFVDEIGAKEIVRRLTAYRDQHGVRFEPSAVLVELASRDGRFYGDKSASAGVAPKAKAATFREANAPS